MTSGSASTSVAPSIAAASSISWLMFWRPPRKISIIVPLVVQIVISMIANMATDGPLSHCHSDSSKTSPFSHDGALSTPNTPSRLWISPLGSSNQLMSSIGRIRLTSPDVRNSTSQISVMAIDDRDRREVEQRAEAAPAAQEPLVDEEGEEQRQHRLDRDDDEHVVERVADRRGEVLAADTFLGEQLAVVVEPENSASNGDPRPDQSRKLTHRVSTIGMARKTTRPTHGRAWRTASR